MGRKPKFFTNRMLFGTFLLMIASLAIVTPSVFGVFAQSERSQAGPVIRTDKAGYVAGETISISGQGFSPNESVMLRVAHDSGTLETGNGHDPWWVYPDADGAFTANWSISSSDTAGVHFVVTADTASGARTQAAFARKGLMSALRLGNATRITAQGFSASEHVSLQFSDG